MSSSGSPPITTLGRSAQSDLASIRNIITTIEAMHNLIRLLNKFYHTIRFEPAFSVDLILNFNGRDFAINSLAIVAINLAKSVTNMYKRILDMFGGRSWLWNHARDMWSITHKLAVTTVDMIHAARRVLQAKVNDSVQVEDVFLQSSVNLEEYLAGLN
jgi:hypothetical protein